MPLRYRFALTLLLLLLASCASFPPVQPLTAYDPDHGYRYDQLANDDNKDDLFVIVTFSGGGTRAAALAYGVLEQLRQTTVVVDGERRNLLKEVDVISSVSGGSFIAAYYGLHGDDIFVDGGRFQQNFLYHNVQRDLIVKMLNPYNWWRLASPQFGRIELAAELYQDLLFDQTTFSDVEQQRHKPFLMINATDMVKGTQFMFTQSQFDPLCADLGSLTVARAVAASSNFPIAFSPLAINSYPGSCHFREPKWVEQALHDLDANPRRYYRARMLRTYQEPDRRYVHLLDGGVADNIGLRGPLTSMSSGDVDGSVLNRMNLEEIKKLVVITVDAKNELPTAYDRSANAPGVATVVESIASVPLINYSFDTIELLKETLQRRDAAQRQQPDLHQVELYRIYVGFDQIEDTAERERFLAIDTVFDLPKEQVNALRQKGRQLLLQSPCFQKLVGAPLEKTKGASLACP
ncbi:MAG: patatin-like phospholipase family protein [Gammaproteobacteria bacterium]|nr:patatin-like phospholipase family protein [Gammaproteobacteria bacterium]